MSHGRLGVADWDWPTGAVRFGLAEVRARACFAQYSYRLIAANSPARIPAYGLGWYPKSDGFNRLMASNVSLSHFFVLLTVNFFVLFVSFVVK